MKKGSSFSGFCDIRRHSACVSTRVEGHSELFEAALAIWVALVGPALHLLSVRFND